MAIDSSIPLQVKPLQLPNPLEQAGQAAQVATLRGTIEKQERQRQAQAELAALGPNPSQEQILAWAGKHADPETALRVIQSSQDRQHSREQAALQFAENLELKKRQLDFQREQFTTRTEDARARQEFEQFYKRESLRLQEQATALNTQLRTLGLEIRANEGRLRIERFDRDARDRTDKAVTSFANELQQNKIPALSASITTANDLLRNYEDKDIPGLGVFVGSGKIPDALRTGEANKVRSALQAVSNDLLNLYSGLAVTLPEAERRQLEEMKNGQFTSEDFKNAWPRIVNRYNTVVGNLKAGAGEPVLKEYQSRPGAMKLDPLEPAFSGKARGAAKFLGFE